MTEALKISRHEAMDDIRKMRKDIKRAGLHDPMIAACFTIRRDFKRAGHPLTEQEFWVVLAHTLLIAKCKMEIQVLEMTSGLQSCAKDEG